MQLSGDGRWTDGRWADLEALFHQAVGASTEDRARLLETYRQEHDTVYRELIELLEADEGAPSTFPGLLQQPTHPLDVPGGGLPEVPGYELLKCAGHGGMGSVYQARRLDPLFDGKLFAVKILHAHRLSPVGRRRFDIERRLLATLDHPSIVRLYDGGELVDGRPFLVMDWVDGETLDIYCRRRRATVEQRLKLFVSLCDALHHAHQHLVVHRDLKPSNILVDTQGLPHLLDFGIAKILGGQAPSTEIGRPMTPAYASPEQADGQPVTTASDIYSLGVVLFELLVDRLPADTKDPGDPSRRPSRALGNNEAVADARRLSLTALRRRLRLELDHVVAKCLRMKPGSRYASARELADDIERHLEGRPVSARQDSWKYVVGHVLRRRFWHLTALLLALGLFGTAAMSSYRAHFLQSEMRLMLRRLAGPDKDLRADIGTLTKTLDQILDLDEPWESKALLIETLRQTNMPTERLLPSVVELIESWQTEGRGSEDVALSIGEMLFHFNRFEESDRVLTPALKLAERSHGTDSVLLDPFLEARARVAAELERFDVAQADIERRLALKARAFGSKDSGLASPYLDLAVILHLQGRFEAAVRANRQALALLDTSFSAPELLVTGLTGLAVNLIELGPLHAEEAETTARRALEIARAHYGESHMESLLSHFNVSVVLARSGRMHEALEAALDLLPIAEASLGPDHPRVAYIVGGIAKAYAELGDYGTCARYAERAVRLRQGKDTAYRTAVSQTRWADCLIELDQEAQALELLRSAVDAFDASKGEDPGPPAEARRLLESLASRDASSRAL